MCSRRCLRLSQCTGRKRSPKILVVYFSKTNHKKNIADTIARLTGADELRVEVVKPYPEAYRPTTQIVKEELEKGIVREITYNPHANPLLGNFQRWVI